MQALSELFDVQYGHSLELNRLTLASPHEGIPFVSRKMGDNGIAAHVLPVPGVPPNPGGTLTCALSGNGVLSTFIQDRPYYTSFHVACLRPLTPLTRPQLLYYCACIEANRFRYSFGRQANRSLKDIVLPSPADLPEWVARADVDVFGGRDAAIEAGSLPQLTPGTWRPFVLGELFDIRKGKRLTKAAQTVGGTPFIGALDNNNGLTGYVGQAALHPGNTMTVNYNGNGVAEAFYQPVPYRCSDDVHALYPKFALTPPIAMFLAAVIRLEKYRFNYGRKWHLDRMRGAVIHLPAESASSPDWGLMERYIRRLPFSSQLIQGA